MTRDYSYKVSVIILTFNHEKFIFETLSSIESQDIDSVQVVVGDDASSDNTNEIIERFSKDSKFDYVKFYNKNNIGISENFNQCLRACTGKYIMLLGGDDVFLYGKIRKQYEYMEYNQNVFISYHDAYVFDSDTGETLLNYSEMFNVKELSVQSLIVNGTFFTGCTPAVRNFFGMPECLEKIKYASDWLWYIEILIASGGDIGCIDSVLSKYRRHSSNVTSNENYERAYSETRDTLIHIVENHPEYKKIAMKSLGERQFAFFLKGILARKWSWSLRLLISSLKNNPFSLYWFLRLRFNSLVYRLSRS